jgi:ribosomal RNA methyltransferase Nop2
MISADPEQVLPHPTSGTEDDDDDRDDEQVGENEAPVREVDDATEAPEEFEVDDEDQPAGSEDNDDDDDEDEDDDRLTEDRRKLRLKRRATF